MFTDVGAGQNIHCLFAKDFLTQKNESLDSNSFIVLYAKIMFSKISMQEKPRGKKRKKNLTALGSIDANILHHVALLFTDFTEIKSKTLTSFNSKMFSFCI